ncbi:unnamed protein product [Amoebophrya sp. A25]|nr:unnamed protein product [Amoebophrya sp. A25]|eukprot:GSA25T00004682001.1
MPLLSMLEVRRKIFALEDGRAGPPLRGRINTPSRGEAHCEDELDLTAHDYETYTKLQDIYAEAFYQFDTALNLGAMKLLENAADKGAAFVNTFFEQALQHLDPNGVCDRLRVQKSDHKEVCCGEEIFRMPHVMPDVPPKTMFFSEIHSKTSSRLPNFKSPQSKEKLLMEWGNLTWDFGPRYERNAACVQAWGCFRKWNNLEFWMRAPLGPRQVPLEIYETSTDGHAEERRGLRSMFEEEHERYLDVETSEHANKTTNLCQNTEMSQRFSEQFISFEEFTRKYLLGYNLHGRRNPRYPHRVAYIAQHNLFEQIPSLKKDVPWARRADVASIWLGTADTVTDLHYDSMDNIYLQVTGWKHVKLARPSIKYSGSAVPVIGLYDDKLEQLCERRRRGSEMPRNEGQSPSATGSKPNKKKAAGYNFSPLRVFGEDSEQPLCFSFLMAPGDVLLIPKYWWHAMKALTPSISVNFWNRD